jgi:hypothetical protein
LYAFVISMSTIIIKVSYKQQQTVTQILYLTSKSACSLPRNFCLK